MDLLFQGSVRKDLQYPDENEDFFLFDFKKNRMALSDGASESFDSRTWSRILSEKYILDPNPSLKWFQEAIETYNRSYSQKNLSWSQQLAFDRGSFATLLGIEINESESVLNLVGIGDSLFVLMDGNHIVSTFPYSVHFQYLEKPTLISTLHGMNEPLLAHPDLWQKKFFLETLKKPYILCMTDALGEWFLKRVSEKDLSYLDLFSFRNFLKYENYIKNLRESKKIKTDDSTLIIIKIKPRKAVRYVSLS